MFNFDLSGFACATDYAGTTPCTKDYPQVSLNNQVL